jgi:hypothetical protein
MLGEALGAIAALKQESLSGRHLGELPLQLARLTGKNERRKPGELLLDRVERLHVRIGRDLLNGLSPPAFRRPPLVHLCLHVRLSFRQQISNQGAAYTRDFVRKASAKGPARLRRMSRERLP